MSSSLVLRRVCAIGLLCLSAAGSSCHPRPVRGGPVDAGPGSVEAVRADLKGTWALSSLTVIDASGARHPAKAAGSLVYDDHANMSIRGTVEGADRSVIVLDFSGRIVIDAQRHQFYAADLQTDRPVDPAQVGAVSPDKVRQFELAGDTFTVTYLDAASKPTAVAVWQRTAR
jgi:hypothetical protein